MEKRLIYALHGFLGKASDWKPVIDNSPDFKFVCGEMFGNEEFALPDFSNVHEKRIFLGYSLGGRIGLRILERYPQSFDQFVFLSTNPGFLEDDTEARQQRLQSDAAWAARIGISDWDNFLNDWNSQTVFQGSAAQPVRAASEFNLQKLKQSLLEDSLGNQPDYRPLIRANSEKSTWVVGSRDLKYRELANNLDVPVRVVESGHRILWDNPGAICQILKNI